MKTLLLVLALLAGNAVAAPVTYYVAPNGATGCDGTKDVPAVSLSPVAGKPGHSNLPHCRWISPMQALPATTYNDPTQPPDVIHAGDTVLIASGDYDIGWRATNPVPGAGACNIGDPDHCGLRKFPDGVKFLGRSATYPPRFHFLGGVYTGLNAENTSNVEVGNITLINDARCKKGAPAPWGCPPLGTGRWLQNGVIFDGATNFYAHNVTIMDVANEAFKGGKNNGYLLTSIHIGYAAEAGIDLDCHDSSNPHSPCDNRGLLQLVNSTIDHVGCVRNAAGVTVQCFGQEHGGYGDGFGTWHTGGHFVFKNVRCTKVISDCLDCLYCDGTQWGSNSPAAAEPPIVDFIGNYIEGAAGNQLKTAGTAHIYRNVLIGDSGPDNWAITPKNNQRNMPPNFVGKYGLNIDEVARADGATVSLAVEANTTIELYNNTIWCQSGGCITTALEGGFSDVGSKVDARNNIVNANSNVDWHQMTTGGGTRVVPCSFDYQAAPTWSYLDNIYFNCMNGQAPPSGSTANPKLKGMSVVAANATLLPGSPAIGTGDVPTCVIAGMKISGGSSTGVPKPQSCNIGAQ